MKGLLVKDFFIMKKQCIFNLIVAVLFFALSVFGNGSPFFAYYSILLTSVVTITIFAYDENNKWNKFEIVSPISRNTVVTSKYLFMLITVIPLALIESVIFAVRYNFDYIELLSLFSVMLFSGFMTPSISFPCVFKLGYQKGRMINVFVIVLSASLTTLLQTNNSDGTALIESGFSPHNYSVFLIPLSIVMLVLSWIISRIIYSKKQF